MKVSKDSPKTIFVSGGGGYIGSHAVKRLLKDGNTVVVFDNFSRGFEEPLNILKSHGKLLVEKGDLLEARRLEEVFAQYKVDAVMHFAALCLVDESMRSPEIYFRNNVLGTLNLLEAMHKAKVGEIVFSSTCAVYGSAQYLPIDEKHPTNPENPYGESKLMAEKMVEWFGEVYGMNYAILRYFNVCGADSEGEIGDSKKPSQLLVQNAVRGALGIEDFKLTCPKVDTPDGTPIRDYIDVEDLIDGHIKALKYIFGGNNILCNLGHGKGWSVKEIVEEVQKELGVSFDIKQGKARKGEYKEVCADNSLAREKLGWSPKKSLQESINSLKTWYENKPEGYQG